eukprot:TRINITY_DN43442_c0_g1_i1.p1 TRINITY_DN43442_c0_g1~~TRINITY_DN43442_c0_g1_i1.p1  ORF type:complete len:221 (+),score=43.95 TRINITY_DN43442_c0_g1_i1:184-846(+)
MKLRAAMMLLVGVQANSSQDRSSVSGKWFNATTTHFGGNQGSCGGCALDMFSGVPGWAVVATAESMQIPYQCKPCPDCHCATGKGQESVGGPAAGCGACFNVQTTGSNLWSHDLPKVNFKAAVADSCPYAANKQWCPQEVGDTNSAGYEFHIDIFSADQEKLGIGENPLVQFQPIECPEEIKSIFLHSCCDVWYKGQGCSNDGKMCPSDTCPPSEHVQLV